MSSGEVRFNGEVWKVATVSCRLEVSEPQESKHHYGIRAEGELNGERRAISLVWDLPVPDSGRFRAADLRSATAIVGNESPHFMDDTGKNEVTLESDPELEIVVVEPGRGFGVPYDTDGGGHRVTIEDLRLREDDLSLVVSGEFSCPTRD